MIHIDTGGISLICSPSCFCFLFVFQRVFNISVALFTRVISLFFDLSELSKRNTIP